MVFILIFTRLQSPPPLFLSSHSHHLWPEFHRTTFLSINPTRILTHRIYTKNRRWDSNAETFRARNFDFDSTGDDEDLEDDDDDDDDMNQWLDILEDFIDGVWIFKAFRSYGLMLPAIIASLLLASGPKAFLMALAVPMGQSALSLLFETVWGKPRYKTRRKGKNKRKAPRRPRAASYMDIDDEQEEYVKRERKRASAYQTWVEGDAGLSGNKTDGSSSSFGGWEELDGRNRSNKDGKPKKPKKPMSKLGRRERSSSETPLLLRLLIAVFPFLGTWTRML